MTIEDAYAEACRQLGEAHVRLAFVQAEAAEAGARVVALVAERDAKDEPDPQ